MGLQEHLQDQGQAEPVAVGGPGVVTRTRPGLAVAILALVLFVVGTGSSVADPASEPEAAIAVADRAYAEAWLDNDAEAIMATLTDDAVLVPSGLPVLEGPQAIRGFWWPEGSPPTTVTRFTLTQHEIQQEGTMGFVRGSFALEFEYDGKTYSSQGEYMSILRRQEDGSWRISRRMWSDRPSRGAQVAFVSDRDGNMDIFLLDVDSGAIQNLTDHPAMDYGFSWSPDGKALAFDSDREGNKEIHVLDLESGAVSRLTQHDARDGSPSWSPDGEWIAFVSRRDSEKGELHVMRADGSEVRRLTDNVRYEEVPSWSPDGRSLVFGAVAPAGEGQDPTLQVFRLDLESGQETQLTFLAGHNSAPRWTPDGTIYFYGQVGKGFDGADILAMDAEGGDLRNLTQDREPDWQPDLSPDGRRLVFARGPGDPLDLWTMRPDGSDRRPLLEHPGRDEKPKWRPDPRAAAWVAAIQAPQYFAVYVADVGRSEEWYRTVFGLEAMGGAAAEDGSWEIENLGNDRLLVELIRDDRAQDVGRARGFAKVGFQVPDVDRVADRVAEETGERPRVVDFPRFGLRILQLRDPDGNTVQLSSPLESQGDEPR